MPELPPVISQKGALVGDENQADTYKPELHVVDAQDAAQTTPERESEPTSVNVHETFVATDVVITDPSAPEAVQVPDAGRSQAGLPIHQLGQGTPEDVFAKEASKAEKPAAKKSSDSSSE